MYPEVAAVMLALSNAGDLRLMCLSELVFAPLEIICHQKQAGEFALVPAELLNRRIVD
jgi:hypothetical protein